MLDPSNVVATRNGSAQQDEINLIIKALLKLEEETETSSQFHQKRAALLRRLNSVQSSTRTLPPEILSLIFQHVYHCYTTVQDRRLLPRVILKLGHVSSYWRQIVWSTPQLWSHFAKAAHSGNIRAVVSLLRLYFKNVGRLPFSVDLIFYRSSHARSAKSFGSIASALFHKSNTAKIRSLRLHDAPWEWAARFNTSNFFSLERLDFRADERGFSESNLLYLAHAACLHDMALSALVPTEINLCWLKITSLQLDKMHIDTCVKLLTSCPNLIEFCCSDPMDPASKISTSSDHHLRGTVALNHLKLFKWTNHGDPCCLQMLRRLRLPALRDLSWTSSWNEPQEKVAIRTLMSSLPTTLSSLTLDCPRWRVPFLKEVFKQTEHVESLCLEFCEEVVAADFFFALTDDVDADARSMLLPSLKKLVILDMMIIGPTSGEKDVLSFPILRFLQNRFRKGCLEFCLGFRGFSHKYPLRVQKQLCQLRREGFKLDMYDRSGTPNWLEAA